MREILNIRFFLFTLTIRLVTLQFNLFLYCCKCTQRLLKDEQKFQLAFQSYYFVNYASEFQLTLTRRLPLVDQELLTLPDHPVSPPVFIGVCVSKSQCSVQFFCRLLFVLFILAIAFSVIRFTASDYPFNILKVFLPILY